MQNSKLIAHHEGVPKPVRLDDTALVLLRHLAVDARIPNNVLASRAGIAPSTCLTRVRALQDSGVIRGFHADIDLAALGLVVQALISVRVHSPARPRMRQIATSLKALPNVLGVFLVAGERDFIAHVACASTDELRDFIAMHLGSNPDLASTNTSLVFEHLTD